MQNININKNPTEYDVARSGVPIWPRWREVAAPILWPFPEAAVTVFSTPDEGCGGTWNM